MKEGLIVSSYECPKCNDQHDVTRSAIKRFLRNCASHAECICSTNTSQNKYGGVHTIIRLAMRSLRLFLKSAVALTLPLGKDQHSQLASIDKNNALQEIKLRLSYLQGKSTTMSVIAHQTEKEWISVNKKSRQRMSQTQAEGAAEQHAARLEDAHLRAHHLCFTTSERC
ncbi:hypothetical protein TNCV_1783821 [Trichonephila clavipes]|nr:hypothetical protein TNCV_1783821 [Trichonephila clavipes]